MSESSDDATRAILRLLDGFEGDPFNMVSAYMQSLLRSAEREALEKAAKVAEQIADSRHEAYDGGAESREVAKAIRALANQD